MMKTKFKHYIVTSLVYLLFLLIVEVKANLDSHERAFYAISSLSFYLEQKISPEQDDTSIKIHFDEADVTNLWLLASCNPFVASKVEEAQQNYCEALSHIQNRSLFLQLFKKSQSLLDAVWKELNPYIPKEPAIIHKGHQAHYRNFDDNPFITKEMRQQMRPYLLPLSHGLKPILDVLSNPFRVLQNEATFARAGFITLSVQPYSRIRIVKHSALVGYLLKVYLDCDGPKIKDRFCWDRLARRCQGAENIRHLINKKQLKHFTVPDKWLYPPSVAHVPLTASPQTIQPVILVVTDMNLVSFEEILDAWRNKVTKRHLDELYCILSHGFSSVYLPGNIPYCKNGKFACVDTETPKKDRRNYEAAKAYFSPEMQIYWDELVRKGGQI